MFAGFICIIPWKREYLPNCIQCWVSREPAQIGIVLQNHSLYTQVGRWRPKSAISMWSFTSPRHTRNCSWFAVFWSWPTCAFHSQWPLLEALAQQNLNRNLIKPKSYTSDRLWGCHTKRAQQKLTETTANMAHLFDRMMHKSKSKNGSDQVSKLCSWPEKLNEHSTEKQQEDMARTLNFIKVKFPIFFLQLAKPIWGPMVSHALILKYYVATQDWRQPDGENLAHGGAEFMSSFPSNVIDF